ncbi:MAG: radical SAM protein [Candidatus Delongbacteria bacterium]|nr:radical SAM protein [Candidatus Delongbacteria bacterium]
MPTIPRSNYIPDSDLPFLLVADDQSRIIEIPELRMVTASRNEPGLPSVGEIIPLPPGSDLFVLPDRIPYGYDPVEKRFFPLRTYQGKRVFPVAAFMPPAYTYLRHTAFIRETGSDWLPLYAYAPVGFMDNQYYTTGIRVDSDIRQDLDQVDHEGIRHQGELLAQRYPHNRLIQHIVKNCAFTYGCPAARNYVQHRWEAPLPTSVSCNARCLGCISLQDGSGLPVTQPRITFVPTPDEIAELIVPHLQTADDPIGSFGQGCEGEPILQADTIAAAVRLIRNQTSRGIINVNSNMSLPSAIETLCLAGVDSFRVSLNSAQPHYYQAYFRSPTYQLRDVMRSIEIAGKYNKWISLNYFIFPGFTDTPDEIRALTDLIRTFRIDYIQMRNLNIDPQMMTETLELYTIMDQPIGILNWMERIRALFPYNPFGYFNPGAEKIRRIRQLEGHHE